MGLASENLSRTDREGVAVRLTMFGQTVLELLTPSGSASGQKTVRFCCRSLVLQQLPPLGGFFWLLRIKGPAANLIYDKFLTPLSLALGGSAKEEVYPAGTGS